MQSDKYAKICNVKYAKICTKYAINMQRPMTMTMPPMQKYAKICQKYAKNMQDMPT